MGILAWIVFGFFTGLIARAVMPGEQKLGFLKTTLLGVAGSFLGGTVASLLTHGPAFGLSSAGFIGSVLGAMLLLGLGVFTGRRS